MKVRIGIGAGRAAPSPEAMCELADDLETLGFDSIWLSEVLSGGGYDPLVAMTFIAAHNPKLKIGTTMLLPGRNPIRLAKALASLDILSNGRLLVTFVPGLAQGAERDTIGVEVRRRGSTLDEMLPLVRELLSGETVTHDGPAGTFSDVRVDLRTVQQPLEFWLGGMVRSSLERCGRLGDGWLPSFCTVEEAAAGKKIIEDAADAAGREISSEHFGVNIVYSHGPLDPAAARGIAARARGHDPSELIATGMDGLRRRIEEYLEAGFSKFVVRPNQMRGDWRPELETLAAGVLDMQT